jgi:hypothetical protein
MSQSINSGFVQANVLTLESDAITTIPNIDKIKNFRAEGSGTTDVYTVGANKKAILIWFGIRSGSTTNVECVATISGTGYNLALTSTAGGYVNGTPYVKLATGDKITFVRSNAGDRCACSVYEVDV